MNFAVNYYRLTLPIVLKAERQCNYLVSKPVELFINEHAPAELSEVCPKKKYIDRWNEKLWLQAQDKDKSLSQRAIAVTALRCYVSLCLDKTAKFIFKKYRSIRPENINLDEVRNLLLRDTDIECLYLLETSSNYRRNKMQKMSRDERGFSETSSNAVEYLPLSFEVLETWNPNLESAFSLNNWTTQKALDSNIMKQLGIDRHTPWYRLMKIAQRRLKLFSDYDKKYIKAFQQVYQLDLDQNRKSYNSPYPDPTQKQLANVSELLKIELKFVSAEWDIKAVQSYLRELADEIRRLYFDMPTNRQLLLEVPAVEIDHDLERAVLDALDKLGEEINIIQQAVQKVFSQHQKSVQSSLERHNINFQKIIYLYYCVGLSQSEIARQINRDQSQVSRLLNPKKYLKQTYVECIDMVIGSVMQDFYFSDDPNIVEDLERYIREIFSNDFEKARKLISSRSKRGKNVESVYFQAICSLYS
ncbi:hypothetical protein Lepto7376_1612 [[Leptolyngbya] sp. PCC 7376]|uniref:helix-turn-helix domain-containing protein n=1 Tax=[Leptolyngbya] sp. PCC 7376 TaxID=111781 RepID=UPI00029EE049|nr:helix-turn-helix domain-containing protein [[Leptolyngbya] sp. PCC 7376]AFY37948.1 hypothetical protein Lepto7376_1612 [[Leptolyngbya] sp. PCC 7376]